MNNNLCHLFNCHKKWIASEGVSGEQLTLKNISSEKLTSEQLYLLIDSILSECSFTDIRLNENDFYHTEMYSCKFSNVTFCKTQFIKSEVNDTEFTNVNFNSVNFSNAEFFDCVFSGCKFNDSTFISAGVWNTIFNGCILTNIDFENAYFENIILCNTRIINPVNLDKATKIVLNIGTAEKPKLLSHEESIKWIKKHSIL